MTADPHQNRELDVRHLPAPEPMLRILQAVTTLPPGAVLRVTIGRVPHPLFPRLRERGLECGHEERADGTVLLSIRRPV
ncbi:MAG: DUF2249 domain-containing protein [Magnetococcales bacterium]|nr:DUF2249 domain-containing protein [Magnetococcales bacterium]